MTTRRPAPSSLAFIEPLHPSEQEKPPAGDDWVHEIIWDGYRVQAHLVDGKATIYTRRGNAWTRQFRSIADAVAKLPAKRAIITGEAVVLSEAGPADFLLERKARLKASGRRSTPRRSSPFTPSRSGRRS